MSPSPIRLSQSTLGVIGFGNLAEAVLGGALKQHVLRPKQILSLKHRTDRDAALRRRYGIMISKDAASLSHAADLIFLAVKPQQMAAALEGLQPHYRDQPVITVAAGLGIRFYRRFLGPKAPLVRVMPNTCAFLGVGAAGYFASSNIPQEVKALVAELFGATGLIREVRREKLIDAVIAVSGSGPAFIYKYAQAVVEGGLKLGLDRATATALAYQTLAGAAQMLLTSGKSPEELIAQVTSKRGTTLAGLSVLEKKNFTGLIQACMEMAVKRSRELSEEMEKLL